jgi:hypothetical protein
LENPKLVPEPSERTHTVMGALGNLTPLLSARIRASFQLVMLPA